MMDLASGGCFDGSFRIGVKAELPTETVWLMCCTLCVRTSRSLAGNLICKVCQNHNSSITYFMYAGEKINRIFMLNVASVCELDCALSSSLASSYRGTNIVIPGLFVFSFYFCVSEDNSPTEN